MSDFLSPPVIVITGMLAVLVLIVGLRLHAFLALIGSAILVSLLVGLRDQTPLADRMQSVAMEFGHAAANIGIIIAMAAILGRCLLESGSADRIVLAAVKITGEKRATLGMMLSGFVLAIPVFFDTVFYLLVPLAKSLHARTGTSYFRYLLAIVAGAAVTHTLVPPTPGPLLMAAILRVDLGMMMLVGLLVAVPAAVLGWLVSALIARTGGVAIPAPLAADGAHPPLPDEKLPPLWLSLLPVLFPVGLIAGSTITTTVADREDRAALVMNDIESFELLTSLFDDAPKRSPAGRILASPELNPSDIERLKMAPTDVAGKQAILNAMNKALTDPNLFDPQAFVDVKIPAKTLASLAADRSLMKPVDLRRVNRSLMDAAYPELIAPHRWDSIARQRAAHWALWGNPNLALFLAALIALLTLKWKRSLSWKSVGADVESSLSSAGVIILITAAGGAFGAMLSQTDVRHTIEGCFQNTGLGGIALLSVGWGIAALLKFAQGSSTVAMIIAAGMMSTVTNQSPPSFHVAYVATAIGSGSMMGSWMNDSGFWIFTKMGGLTESQGLRSWTPLLACLSLGGFMVTVALSHWLPLVP